MPGISVNKIPIPFKKAGINWSSYWSTLISATVENAAPTHVVLTFPTAAPSLGASDFTIAGFTINSASWTGAMLTLVLSASVVTTDNIILTFVKTGSQVNVTNNVYLFHDQFITDDAAPMTSPRSCEPTGILTIVDTNNYLSISSGKLQIANKTTNFANPLIYSGAIERIAGRVLYGKVKNIGQRFGYSKTANSVAVIFFNTASGNIISVGNLQTVNTMPYTTGTEYELMILTKGNLVANIGDSFSKAGYLFFIKGGAYTSWTLIGSSDYYNGDEPLYITYSCTNENPSSSTFDDLMCYDLGGSLSKHFPLAITKTAYPYTVSNGSEYTNAADGILTFQVRIATNDLFDIQIRRTDDDNCWIIRVNQAGTIKIIEKIGGSETEKASGNQTFLNGGNYNIRIIQNGATIRVFSNATEVVNYGTAATQLTATGGKISGTFTQIIYYTFWPLTYSDSIFTSGLRPKSFLPYGDSKTAGTSDDTPPLIGTNGYPPILAESLNNAYTFGWYERPFRIAVGGITTETAASQIDAKLAAAYGTPDYICYNLGANDTTFDAAWETNTAYILDAMHTKYPNAKIYCAVIWTRAGGAVKTAAQRAALTNVLSTRGSFAFMGIDESIFLENGDDGVTYTADGVHPNRAGYILTAAQWKTVMGL